MGVLLLTGTLAGCIGGDEAPSTGDDPDLETSSGEAPEEARSNETTPTGAAPNWTHGDWWTYDINFDLGFGTILDEETTLVLHDVQDGLDVAAADRPAAIVDQYFDLFAVGELDAQLNPTSQEGFQMFSFPLEDGKTWETQVSTPNGTSELTLTAERVEDAGDPAGSTPGYLVHGENDDDISLTYTYSPKAGWVTSFELVAPSFDGEPRPVTQMELTDHGAAYEGTFVILEMEDLYFRQALAAPFPNGGTVPPQDTVTVPDGFTFVQRIVGIFSFDVVGPTSGVERIDLEAPDGGSETYQQMGEGDLFEILTDEPPVEGDWQVRYAGAGTAVMIVGFFGFTETIVEFTTESHAHHT